MLLPVRCAAGWNLWSAAACSPCSSCGTAQQLPACLPACQAPPASCLPRPACPAASHPAPTRGSQLGLGDDQHRSGYEAALDPWLQQLWAALRARFPLPPGTAEPAPGDTATDLVCKYRVTWLQGEEAAAAAAAAAAEGCTGAAAAHREAVAAACLFDHVEAAAAGLPLGGGAGEQPSSRAADAPATKAGAHGGACSAAGYGPRRPYWARLLGNRRITAPTHFQDVRRLDIELADDASLAFQPGDVLAIAPQQPQPAVDALVRRCGWDLQAWVRVEPAAGGGDGGGDSCLANGATSPVCAADAGHSAAAASTAAHGSSSSSCTQPPAVSATVRLGALVAGALDINGASPRRFFFQVAIPGRATADPDSKPCTGAGCRCSPCLWCCTALPRRRRF